jgi:multiple sugar transport system ATP-binding protein
MSGVVIRGLSKVYGDSVKALESLDLDVAAGELLVVVGPSGSGKTTLLRLVAGLDRPTAGTIRLNGRDGVERELTGVPPRERDVALVFQSLALYGHLTVEQNLAFALNAQTWKGRIGSLWRRGAIDAEAQEKVLSVARLLGIEHLLARRPAELSGGEQQRVALGRAIVREPKALLLDEPLSSLDLPTRRTLRRELKDLQRRLNVPTIYVTHDQAEALAIGDRIAVLDRGRLVQVGTPSEIYERPRTRFVAEFFGPMGMNLIEGELVGQGLEFRGADGTYVATIPIPSDYWPDALVDGPVVLGIRPEDIGLNADESSETAPGKVITIVNLGESTYLHVQLTDVIPALIVRVPDNATPQPELGDTVQIQLPPDRLHWF